MIKIILAVAVIANGSVFMFESKESYPTVEACEAAKEARVAEAVVQLEAQMGTLKVQSACEGEEQGQPS